jgi:hypothetical protein
MMMVSEKLKFRIRHNCELHPVVLTRLFALSEVPIEGADIAEAEADEDVIFPLSPPV